MRRVMVFVLLGIFVTSCFAKDIMFSVNGKNILLHDDFTWEYKTSKNNEDSDIKVINKNDKLTTGYESKNGKYNLYIDEEKWKSTTGNNDSAEFQFVNKEQTGFAMVLYDGLSIPLESMEKILIVNANNVDPNAKIVNIQKCNVNGTEGELVTYEASTVDLDFTFYTFIASNESGTIQYTFYTLSSYFNKMKEDFELAISGMFF